MRGGYAPHLCFCRRKESQLVVPVGLFALALAGFGIGITEFVIVGLLPDVAAEFAVFEGTAGILVSGYAIAVAVGAVTLTAAVARFERKNVLLVLMGVFIVGNVLSALAPTYEVMLAGRIIAALCHGAFYGVGTVVAASLVDEHRKASAISFMFAGLTVAMVLGVPAGTFLGQLAGWRSTFWAIAIIAAISGIGIAFLVRPRESVESAPRLRDELRVVLRGRVVASALVSLLVSGGVVAAFTYTNVSGLPEQVIPWLLLLFGVGTFVGNAIGGRLADRSINRTLFVFVPVSAIVMALFALFAGVTPLAIVFTALMGITAFINLPGLQLRIMSLAADAPTMASGANIAALIIGNALGVALAGVVITTPIGFTGPIWVGAAFAAIAFIILLATMRLGRSTDRTRVPEGELVSR